MFDGVPVISRADAFEKLGCFRERGIFFALGFENVRNMLITVLSTNLSLKCCMTLSSAGRDGQRSEFTLSLGQSENSL